MSFCELLSPILYLPQAVVMQQFASLLTGGAVKLQHNLSLLTAARPL